MKRLFHIIVTIGLLSGCSSNSTNLDSDDYESETERVEILKKEINASSDFRDAEFELFNVNGFHNQRTSVPGASSWDYKFVVKTKTTNVSDWTNGMQLVTLENYDQNWTKELVKNRKQNWIVTSEPKYFIRDGESVQMLVYESEGIIFKRVTNL